MEEIENLVDLWLQGYYKCKAGQDQVIKARKKLLPIINQMLNEKCKNDEKFHNKIEILNVLATIKNKYNDIDFKYYDKLRKIFGESFDVLFKPTLSIEFKDEILQDEKIFNKIIDAVGKENMSKFFKIKKALKPTNEFHIRRFTNSKIKEEYNKLVNENIIKNMGITIKPIEE